MGIKKFDILGKTNKPRFNINSNSNSNSKNSSKFIINDDDHFLITKIIDVFNLPLIESDIEKIVYINEKTNDITDPPYFIGSKLGLHRHVLAYKVSTDAEIKNVQLITYINEISSNRELKLRISYSAKCPKGNEEQVVKTLYKNPEKTLNELIVRWIKEFHAFKNDLILHFYSLQDEIQRYITNKAQELVGLKMEVSVSLDHDERKLIKPLDFKTEFPVRVKGYNKEIILALNCQLDIDENHRINAILKYKDLSTLKTRLVDMIKSYILLNISSIETFYLSGNYELTQTLIIHLNGLLRLEGRKISFLDLSSELTDSLPQDFFSYETDINCTIKDSPQEITINHKLLMDLQHPADYKMSGIEDLNTWAKDKLEKITRNELFSREYSDLILNINEIHSNIKTAIENEASLIGYTIKHLLVIPNMEPLTLFHDGFRIEEDQAFITKDTNIDVKLSLILSAKLGDLTQITSFLKPQINLLDEIKKDLILTLKDTIHGISAERFYMRFSFSDKAEEPAVESLLHSSVIDALKGKYHLENIDLKINTVDTSVTNRLKELLNGTHKFDLRITPLRLGENINFTLIFQIKGVDKDGWYSFQANKYNSSEEECNSIIEVFKEDIKTYLNTLPIELLKYEDIKQLRDLEAITKLSLDKIKQTFGLIIEVVTFNRHPSSSEAISQEILSIEDDSLLEENKSRSQFAKTKRDANHILLENLYHKRNKILENRVDEDEDELEELKIINSEIKKIEKNASTLSTNRSKVTKYSEEKKKFSIEDFSPEIKQIQTEKNTEND